MKLCTRCVLPENFPGLRFNGEGICNYCQDFSHDRLINQKTEYRQRFEHLLKEHAGKSDYDAILSYSGGKDSTFMLLTLRQDYHLNVLAFTMDNGFISGQTIENIHRVIKYLGVDHLLFKPRFDVLRSIFSECAQRNIYPAKTVERASPICTACMSIIRFSVLRTAIENHIPFIVYGWSPGQAPITSSILKNNAAMLKLMQKTALEPLHEIAGDAITPYFLRTEHFSVRGGLPFNVHPFAFLEYDEGLIYDAIGKMGWRPPQDTDANSSNCLLNSFANSVHKERFGFHPYAFELASLVRQGYLKRSVAIARLPKGENAQLVNKIRIELGLSE